MPPKHHDAHRARAVRRAALAAGRHLRRDQSRAAAPDAAAAARRMGQPAAHHGRYAQRPRTGAAAPDAAHQHATSHQRRRARDVRRRSDHRRETRLGGFMKKVVLVAALALPVVAFAKGNLKPGNWHIKVTHEFVGAPFTPPPTEIDQCITPQQADDPKQMAKAATEDCDPADVKMEGNKLTFKVVCHSHGRRRPARARWSTPATRTRAPRRSRWTIRRWRPSSKIINHTTANRTGDCASELARGPLRSRRHARRHRAAERRGGGARARARRAAALRPRSASSSSATAGTRLTTTSSATAASSSATRS